LPRTWGYILIAVAAVIGAGALLLPVPETIEVERYEPAPTPGIRQPATPPTPSRARQKAQQEPEARKPPPRPVPMQDTTKTRQLIQPKPKS